MNEKKLIKRATAVLNPPDAINDFIVFSQKVGRAMDSSPYFSASSVLIAKLTANTQSLSELEITCVSTPLTTNTKARDAARVIVENDLRDLCLEVQKIANADPVNAETIITSAGMSVKMSNYRGKQQNTASNGIEIGAVDLTAEGKGSHNWRYSTDEIEWVNLFGDGTSKLTATGFTSGVVYSFQNQMVLPNKQKTEWSQSVKLRIR